MLPQLLEGDRYVVGLSLHQSTRQVAQVAGYAVGGAIAPFYPRLALLIDAGTFALSALLIRFGVSDRRPIGTPSHNHLGRDTIDGFRVVFGTPVLRAIATLVFTSMLFAIVPEGLAAAWAAKLAGEASADRGWMQALIMVANPIGFIAGGLLVGRLVAPETRRRLIRPFAVLAPLALIPAVFKPSVVGVAVMAAVCGFAVAGLMPPTNGLFVQALPASFRARAYGVMQGGVQVMQGIAVLVTGLLAERFSLHLVVGVWSAAGVIVVVFAVSRWPSRDAIAAAIEKAHATNGTAERTVEVEPATVELPPAVRPPRPPVLGPEPATVEFRPLSTTAGDPPTVDLTQMTDATSAEHVGRHRKRETQANPAPNGFASRARARGRAIMGLPPASANPEHSEAGV